MKTKTRFFLLIICILGIQASIFIGNTNLPYNNEAYIFVSLFLLLTFYSLCQLLGQIQKEAREQIKLDALKAQLKLAQKQSAALKANRQKTIAFQQKTIRQLEEFRELLIRQDYETIRREFPAMHKTFQEERFHPICGDSLLNAILLSKKETAEQYGIDVRLAVVLPESMQIKITDLSSVFFNLLDNGIESCLRAREISGNTPPHILYGFPLNLRTAF